MIRPACLVPIACMATRAGNCRVCSQHRRRSREHRERVAALPPVEVPLWAERAGLSERYTAEARAFDEHVAAAACRSILRSVA